MEDVKINLLSLPNSIFLTYVIVVVVVLCVHAGYMCVGVHAMLCKWRSEESVLSFHLLTWVPGVELRAAVLHSNHLYPLSRLATPQTLIFKILLWITQINDVESKPGSISWRGLDKDTVSFSLPSWAWSWDPWTWETEAERLKVWGQLGL